MKLLFFSIAITFLIVFAASCGAVPDTSAPERVEIERSKDWSGALLFIADEKGPVAEYGSVRIFDNTTGFVEKTIEQTAAALPGDVYVLPDETSMFVASRANGLIDRFNWDGNNWINSGITIETPSRGLSVIKGGPDGLIYAVNDAPVTGPASILVLNRRGELLPAMEAPGIARVTGLSWSADSTKLFLVGQWQTDSAPILVTMSWPDKTLISSIDLPLSSARQLVTSPDGKYLFVMGESVLQIDLASGRATTFIQGGGNGIQYVDGDFSADGHFMFITVDTAGGSDLEVVDLKTGATIKTIIHIATKAGGIQRVE
jgi:hypothetical protein